MKEGFFEKLLEKTIMPEGKVWVSVLWQALEDAIRPENFGREESEADLQKQGYDFLFKRNMVFDEICELLELHPDWARKNIRTVYDSRLSGKTKKSRRTPESRHIRQPYVR